MSFDDLTPPSAAETSAKKSKKKESSEKSTHRRKKHPSSDNLKDMEHFHESLDSVDSAIGLFSLTGNNSFRVQLNSSSHSQNNKNMDNKLSESFADFSQSLLDANDLEGSFEKESLFAADDATKKKKKSSSSSSSKPKQSSTRSGSRSPTARGSRTTASSRSRSKSPGANNTSSTTSKVRSSSKSRRTRSFSPTGMNAPKTRSSSKSRRTRSFSPTGMNAPKTRSSSKSRRGTRSVSPTEMNPPPTSKTTKTRSSSKSRRGTRSISPTEMNAPPSSSKSSRSRSKSPSQRGAPSKSISRSKSPSRKSSSPHKEGKINRSKSLDMTSGGTGSEHGGTKKFRGSLRPKREKSSGSAGSFGVDAANKNGKSSTKKHRDDEHSHSASSIPLPSNNGEKPPLVKSNSNGPFAKSPLAKSNDPLGNGEKPQSNGFTPLPGESVLEQTARAAALACLHFDGNYSVKNEEREKSICKFQGDEVILASSEPIRTLMNYSEYQLKRVHSIVDRIGTFPPKMEATRNRIMDRSTDGSYCIKIARRGLLEQSDVGPAAAADIALECCILQNLPGHPNIAPLYGWNERGIAALTDNDGSLRGGFFMITDRIQELLPERLNAWKNKEGYDSDKNKFSQRLEVALDISSALQYLHDRKLVFHIRPSKVGFDAKHGCLKLFNFSEARQDGSKEQSPFVTMSVDMSSLRYTAPEVLCNAPVTCSSDVFGFAIVLWQILSLKQPFDGLADRKEYFEKVVEQHLRPRISSKWPPEIGKLLERCWDPHLRMSMTKVTEELENLLLF